MSDPDTTTGDSGQRPTRKEKERQARRQLIMDAALVVFAYKGFHEAKLDDVAERAEFGKATLYSYFATKEALFEAVLEDVFGRLVARAQEAFGSEGSFQERLTRYVTGEITTYYGRPESLHLMMGEASHLRGANPMIRLMPQLIDIIGNAIEEEQRNGSIRSDYDPRELATILHNMVFAQFLARINRLLTEKGIELSDYDDDKLRELMEQIKTVEVDREVSHATTLIRTIFLNGVHS